VVANRPAIIAGPFGTTALAISRVLLMNYTLSKLNLLRVADQHLDRNWQYPPGRGLIYRIDVNPDPLYVRLEFSAADVVTWGKLVFALQPRQGRVVDDDVDIADNTWLRDRDSNPEPCG
jgi:hypothetical protein